MSQAGRAGAADRSVCFAACSRKVLASMVWKKSCRGAGWASLCTAGALAAPRLSRASSTVWYTASNTSRSRANFTWVLAGWTFTSTAVTGTVTDSTQPGNLPFMIWLRYPSSSAAVSSWDLMNRPLTKNTCMDREPRPWSGPVMKPFTATSPPRPAMGTSPRAKSRPRAAYTAESSFPSPGVWRASWPSLMNLKEISGWDRARCCISPPTAAVSALSLRMNFSRAGVL